MLVKGSENLKLKKKGGFKTNGLNNKTLSLTL